MTPGRFADRYKHYKKLVGDSPLGRSGSAFQQESMLRSMDNAHRLLSSKEAAAFDLTLETEESCDAYNTGPLRAGLPAGAAAGRIRRALHRGDHRIHPLRALGHPRERAHDGEAAEERGRSRRSPS